MNYKELKTREESYLEFTDEEMQQFGLNKGDKFTWKPQDDGSIFLEKWKSIEIDFEDFSKEQLFFLINHSVENNCTINDSINTLLKKFIEDDFS
jgi:hypothetical protein